MGISRILFLEVAGLDLAVASVGCRFGDVSSDSLSYSSFLILFLLC